jgi:hypothetical protein
MMNNRKFSKSALAKPTKYLLLFKICFVFNVACAQSPFSQEIEKHREHYKEDFITNENSPLKSEDLKFLDFYTPDENYKVLCKFKPGGMSEPFEIPTSSGSVKTYVRFGKLAFKVNGKKLHLTVYRSLALMNNPLYKDYLFIPFKDATSGNSTYGGGRYIDLRMSEFEGKKVWLDFNKSYNPYCAFSEGYSCPIPPKENLLKVSVEAGEKSYNKPFTP